MDFTDQLEHAFTVASRIVHGVTSDMLDRPKPCHD